MPTESELREEAAKRCHGIAHSARYARENPERNNSLLAAFVDLSCLLLHLSDISRIAAERSERATERIIKLTERLVFLTYVLVAFTIALVVLTIFLIKHG